MKKQQPFIRPFDLRPLEQKVTFKDRFNRWNRQWLRGVVYIWALFFLFLAGVRFLLPTYPAMGVLTIIVVIIAIALTLAGYVTVGDELRLSMFAKRNGLWYTKMKDFDGRPGMAFQRGTDRRFMDVLCDRLGRFTEVGNFSCRTGNKPHSFGFIRLKLLRKLPHMLLLKTLSDGSSSRRLAGMPVSVEGQQHLSLEGDFDKHFTLYVPKGYGAEALYVFTPDIMELFIQSANSYDCEIIDDNLYIYSDRLFETYKKSGFEEIVRIVTAVYPKVFKQTSMYGDSKIDDKSINEVTDEGKRLKKGGWIGPLLFLVVAIVLYVVQLLR